MKKLYSILVVFGALLALAATPVVAQDNFYKGKTITIAVGASANGSYAAYTNLLAKHLGKHIPGEPVVKPDFRGGTGGGLAMAQYMELAAPKDGTHLGITQQTIPVNQFLQPDSGKYDVTGWQWIGGISAIRNMLSVWHTAPAQTIEEARENEVSVGATSSSSPMYIVPHMMNTFLGTKFKIITGYNGIGGTNLAMEQGEIQGRGASWASVVIRTPHYIEEKLLKPLVVDGATRDPAIPDVPTLIELATDDESKQVFEFLSASSLFGRSYFLPPGVPEERAEILRAAFDKTMQDADFLAEAKDQNINIAPVSADDLTAAVTALTEVPEAIVARAAEAMAAK